MITSKISPRLKSRFSVLPSSTKALAFLENSFGTVLASGPTAQQKVHGTQCGYSINPWRTKNIEEKICTNERNHCMVHPRGAYTQFQWHEVAESISTPTDRMSVVSSSPVSPGTHSHWVEWGKWGEWIFPSSKPSSPWRDSNSQPSDLDSSATKPRRSTNTNIKLIKTYTLFF
jgi:hypothetical protein